MRSRLLACLLCIVAMTCASCGGGSPAPPAPVTGSSSTATTVTVTGTEKIAWDQPADGASRLAHYRYVGYVDDVRQVLADATCGSSSVSGLFRCTAGLPKMTAGSHRLELAVEEIDGLQLQSPRSVALLLNVVTSKAAAAASLLPHSTITDPSSRRRRFSSTMWRRRGTSWSPARRAISTAASSTGSFVFAT